MMTIRALAVLLIAVPVGAQVAPEGQQMAWYGTGDGVRLELPAACASATVTVSLWTCKPLQSWIDSASLAGFNNGHLWIRLTSAPPPNGSKVDIKSFYYGAHLEGCEARSWSRSHSFSTPWLWLGGGGSKYLDELVVDCDGAEVYRNGFEAPLVEPGHPCYRQFGSGGIKMPDIMGGCIAGWPTHGGHSLPDERHFPPLVAPPPEPDPICVETCEEAVALQLQTCIDGCPLQ